MKKVILTISALCFAITIVFGQQQMEVVLSDDNPSFVSMIGDECTFSISKGETDAQSFTPVYIELENNSDKYLILLFNHAWSKDNLRNARIYFEKGFTGESVHKIENIDNTNSLITIPYNEKHQFPQITIKEGESFECLVPIHIAKEKKMFFSRKKKKIIDRIHDVNIKISVENMDPDYLPLKQQCDSLVDIFNDSIRAHAFCTNKLHRPVFEEQIKQYTDAKDDLRLRINLAKNKWKPESSKFQNYVELLSELDGMDDAIEEYRDSKYDCGDKNRHKAVHNCKYCKLSLEEIYNLLDRHYKNVYNKKVEKKQVINEVNALYKCCTNPTSKHAAQWKKGGRVKNKIIQRYNQIKEMQ